MSEENHIKLWVELEALLDVRLAILHDLDPSAMAVALDNGYYRRPVDDWDTLTQGKVTKEAFEERYIARDKELLKEALPTRMNLFLKSLCHNLLQQRANTPFVSKVCVVVNTWPYDFTDNEQTTLCAVVGHYVGEEIDVMVAHQDTDHLTPRRLQQEYAGVVLYNFNYWFRRHHQALDAQGCPRVAMFAPTLFLNEVPDPAQLKEELADFATQDPFRLLEISVQTKIHLQHMDITQYSAIDLKEVTAS